METKNENMLLTKKQKNVINSLDSMLLDSK